MKKVINGKKYDTDKAREVGHWTNGFQGCDHMKAVLYRKRTGEYFLMKQVGEWKDDLGFQVDIIPMELADAKEWASGHIDKESFNVEFLTPGGDKSVPMTVNVPEWVWMVIKNNATVRGTSMGAEVTRLVSDFTRFSLDRFLCAVDTECEWEVEDRNKTLFDSSIAGNELQSASRGLYVESVRVKDGKLLISAFKGMRDC